MSIWYMNVEKRIIFIAVPVRPNRGPDGTRSSTGSIAATAVAVPAAYALRWRRADELCVVCATESHTAHLFMTFGLYLLLNGRDDTTFFLDARTETHVVCAPIKSQHVPGLPCKRRSCCRLFTSVVPACHLQVWDVERVGGDRVRGVAEVIAGLGSVPLGRWHGPGRHARSVPVPARERADRQSTFCHAFVPITPAKRAG